MTELTPQIITGLPAAMKDRPRADFRPNEFDQAIVTKGYRMFWSRAGLCPCSNNDQTEQPKVTCPLCKGEGHYYFLPDEALAAGATKDVFGNPVTLNEAGDAVQIYVLMTSMAQDTQIYEKFGEWTFGSAKVTVQHQNKLGYRDRLIAVDAEMTWAQIIEYDGSAVIPFVGERNKHGLRYPFVKVYQLRSLAQIYREGVHFTLTADGEIEWLASQAPASGTRLSLHGTIHPRWIVMDHVNAYRDTLLDGGAGITSQQVRRLPVHAMAKLDFLVNP